MIARLRHGVAATAAFCLAAHSPAQAACWDVSSIAAARVSEFETLLMVSMLRCKSSGIDMQTGFDAFLAANKTTLESAHLTLRARYGVSKTKRGNNDYDRFVTSVANTYGMGQTEAGVCQQVGVLLADLAKDGSADLLADAVIQMVRDPHLDEARCPTAAATLAQAK